jgi:hypothetical protein
MQNENATFSSREQRQTLFAFLISNF